MRLKLICGRTRGIRVAVRAFLSALLIVAACPCWSLHAAAQKIERVRVTDSILGVRPGSTLEEAREKLKRLVKPNDAGEREDEREGERESEREGGRKEAWMLKKTAFTSIAYQAGEDGRIRWVTGFVRAGHEIPFSKLGDLSHAAHKSEQAAVWNIQRPEGNIRLIAKGFGGKARVVQIFSLNAPSVP
jgi:hypothetical protein